MIPSGRCFNTAFLGPGSLHRRPKISRLIKQGYPAHKLRDAFTTPTSSSTFFPLRIQFQQSSNLLSFTVISVCAAVVFITSLGDSYVLSAAYG